MSDDMINAYGTTYCICFPPSDELTHLNSFKLGPLIPTCRWSNKLSKLLNVNVSSRQSKSRKTRYGREEGGRDVMGCLDAAK
jgi:hypothetical protein